MKAALLVLFYLAFVIGLWAGFLALLSKRDDVSSIDFLLAGPAILLFPERYLKAKRVWQRGQRHLASLRAWRIGVRGSVVRALPIS